MIKVLSPGLLSTIQDLGRFGYQKFGVIVSGAMDQLSHKIANFLVGNAGEAPTIEITLMGPRLHVQKDCLLSICGADFSPTIDGEPMSLWRPVYVKAGSLLSFGSCRKGCRAYLAVAGGYNIPSVLHSASTYMRAGIGGFKGRPLKSGDELLLGNPSEGAQQFIEKLTSFLGENKFVETKWSVASDFFTIKEDPTVRVMEGRDTDLFDPTSLDSFFSQAFEVSTQADRMGYRLKGPEIRLKEPKEKLSESVSFGTVQVPADGQPILLMADHQTTGGYPKIGQVISVDLPIVGQLKPGDQIKFRSISHEDAQRLYIESERKLSHLKRAIMLKIRGDKHV